MATYISLVQFTDKGIHAAKETTQRVAEWGAKVLSKGVTIKHMYWTLGQYDQVCVFEAPDDETAASVLLSADMLGNIRTQTLRAFTSDEMERFSPTFLDRGESARFCERAERLLWAVMIGARAGRQWSFVGSLRDEAHLYRGLSRASTTGQ